MTYCKNYYPVKTDLPEAYDRKRKIRYINAPFTFDTETTSFMLGDRKCAIMYIWMFSIDGDVVYGRTWEEFIWFLDNVKQWFKLDNFHRCIVYVHNLGYDFQFMRGHVSVDELFARKKRHPMKALIEDAFEFRCSYILSGLSLEKTGENLTRHKVAKQVGSLDYRITRHSKTQLTKEELKYCEYDCLVIDAYIREQIEDCGDITKIPLTVTGFVREYCRNYIKRNTNYYFYRQQILKEAPINKELFIILNKAFAGGYVHTNCQYVFDEVEDVYSIDFTSSYPAQMIRHKYPRGKFTKYEITSKKKFERYVSTYACVFKVIFKGVKSKTSHHIWSSSKCEYGTKILRRKKEIINPYHASIDNGRIMQTDEMCTYMTDVDWKIFNMFYTCEDYIIEDFYMTHYDHLPKELIECILHFYKDKTELKGISDKKQEYLRGKGMLNSIYGMCVTNPVNDEIIFEDNLWSNEEPPIDIALEKTYTSNNTFICYQWGVWVTAWARYELLSGVLEINEDVVYCDTDSIKFINYENHKKYIENYNKQVTKDLEETVKSLGIPVEKLYPLDIKGKTHPLGVWDLECKYDVFKALGAKRYAYIINGKMRFTVSGLPNVYIYEDEVEDKDGDIEKTLKNKKLREWCVNHSPMQYILNNGGMSFFDIGMEIPKEWSSRLTHSYGDDYFECELKDCFGDITTVSESNYVHMEPSSFKISIGDDFAEFLKDTENEYTLKRSKRDELAINRFEKEVLF